MSFSLNSSSLASSDENDENKVIKVQLIEGVTWLRWYGVGFGLRPLHIKQYTTLLKVCVMITDVC